MQIKSLRIKSYRSWPIADKASTEAIVRIKKIELYEQLKSEGCSRALRLQATYYRWLKRYRQAGWSGLEAQSCRPGTTRQQQWTKQHQQAVLHLRKHYPEALNISLFVLPPRKPKWNGCVERANGTTRYEFYPFYEGALTIASVNQKLEQYQHYYNHYRPHDGVGLETPMSYYQQLMQAA